MNAVFIIYFSTSIAIILQSRSAVDQQYTPEQYLNYRNGNKFHIIARSYNNRIFVHKLWIILFVENCFNIHSCGIMHIISPAGKNNNEKLQANVAV